MTDIKKWTIFGYNEEGPFIVLITDFDWYDSNREKIDAWFDLNYPSIKPDKNDTTIQFRNKNQLTAWKLTWGY